MKQIEMQDGSIRSFEEVRHFPLRMFFLALVAILAVLSLLGLSVQTDNFSSGTWKVSADIRVSSTTLALLLLAWLPLLIPWIVHLSPRIREFLIGLREGGVEEIEAGILKIKLGAGVHRAADAYENTLPKPDGPTPLSVQSVEAFDQSYQETLTSLNSSTRLNAPEALQRVDQLCLYYDRVRETIPSGPRRTRLMTGIASTMWALAPSIPGFPFRQRLNSALGGERLSAYKYLEWQATPDCLELLLSRAIGVLEVPFGQWNALLALRRIVSKSQIDAGKREFLLQNLRWSADLEFQGGDRRFLMKTIISELQHSPSGSVAEHSTIPR
jgi:hypothetical protein